MATAMSVMLDEFREEAAATKRVLGRVPAEKLTWQPHPKSMSLGQLAMHIATVPADVLKITENERLDVSQTPRRSRRQSTRFTRAFGETVGFVEKRLESMTDDDGERSWQMMRGDMELFSRPRREVMRTIMLNHWYHHRGQLTVYLRLLDVPLPSVYGPSADESPFS